MLARMLLVLAFAFVAGVLTILAPCALPVIPLGRTSPGIAPAIGQVGGQRASATRGHETRLSRPDLREETLPLRRLTRAARTAP